MVSIRKAIKEDLEVIVKLNTELFKHDHAFDDTLDIAWPDSKWGRDYFIKRIKDIDSLTLIAEDDGEIVGYMIAHQTETPDHMKKDLKLAEIENTFIVSSYRRKGLGKEMYTVIEKWAKEKNANLITITASYNNEFGRSFYNKMGLIETDVTFQKKL